MYADVYIAFEPAATPRKKIIEYKRFMKNLFVITLYSLCLQKYFHFHKWKVHLIQTFISICEYIPFLSLYLN